MTRHMELFQNAWSYLGAQWASQILGSSSISTSSYHINPQGDCYARGVHPGLVRFNCVFRILFLTVEAKANLSCFLTCLPVQRLCGGCFRLCNNFPILLHFSACPQRNQMRLSMLVKDFGYVNMQYLLIYARHLGLYHECFCDSWTSETCGALTGLCHLDCIKHALQHHSNDDSSCCNDVSCH